MATVKTYSGSKLGTLDVDEKRVASRILGRTLKEALVMYEANKRQGTHKAKQRSEVQGSQKKMYKQKHTGRARAGDIRSPLRRGGGTIFAPRPRDYSYQMPKKQRRVALASAIYAKLIDDEVVVAEGLPTDAPSTKSAVAVLDAVGADRGALVVTNAVEPNVVKSLRNVPNVEVLPVSDLNAHAVLRRRHVVFTPDAFDALLARDFDQRSTRRGQERRGDGEVNDG